MSASSVVAMETDGGKDLSEMSVNCVSGPPQWDFMHGLMENAVYGGRMDNMFDMRVLQTCLRQCFDDKTIPGQAGAPRRGGRKWEGLPFGTIPVSTRIQDYQSVVSSLPETDRPSFFGLPANIERSSQRTISSRVISQLKVVTRRGDVEGKFDREAWAAELSPLLNLWKKLNQGSELISKRVSPPSDSIDSPVLAFVALERYNAVRLAQTVHSNLAALNRVLRGTSLLTPSVQQLARALLKHEVPTSWCDLWEGPDDPTLYLRSVVGKALALGAWEERGRGGTLLQGALDLSELFHPNTFLNALRQQTAR